MPGTGYSEDAHPAHLDRSLEMLTVRTYDVDVWQDVKPVVIHEHLITRECAGLGEAPGGVLITGVVEHDR